MAALVTIGATELPNPSTYNVGIQDIVSENSRRNANGKLIADRIAQKVTLELGWKYLTNAQYVAILALFSAFFFSVTYHDPTTGTIRTKTFYVSDRKSGIFKYNSNTNSITGWESVSFNIIEQ